MWGRAASTTLVGVGLKGPWLREGPLATGQAVRKWAYAHPDRLSAAVDFVLSHTSLVEVPRVAGQAIQLLAGAWACR